MKFFVFLCAVVAVVSSGAVRDKRGFISGGWDSGYSGFGHSGYSGIGLNSARVVAVNKVVNVNRVVEVPQVVNVRKVVSVPQVVTVKKIISEPTYSTGYSSLGAGYGSSYSSGWW